MLFPVLRRSCDQRNEAADLGRTIDWFLRDFEASPGIRSVAFPKLSISEDASNYVVEADVPGLEKKDITVSVKDGDLMISGERKSESESRDKQWHRVERFSGAFSRSVSLPDDVKSDEIKAEYKNGVLSVTLPKTEERKVKAVNVDIA